MSLINKNNSSVDQEVVIARDGDIVFLAGKKVRAFKVTDINGVEELEVKTRK